MNYSVILFNNKAIYKICSEIIFYNIVCAITLYLSIFICPSYFLSFAFINFVILVNDICHYSCGGVVLKLKLANSLTN